jgi:ADP-ribose diphosphatase
MDTRQPGATEKSMTADASMYAHLETLRVQTVFRGPVFDVVEERIRLAPGTVRRHITVRHPGAVVLLPYDTDGTLLVIKQYRHSLRQVLLEFPAGTLETGEAPLTCAKRELAEEVGRAAARWEALGELHPAPGFCNEVQYCFFATELSPYEAQRDEDELIELLPMRSGEVEQAIRDGRMTDGKSIAVYLRGKLRGLI